MIKFLCLTFLLLVLSIPTNSYAQNKPISDCGNRYVTFVNPIRSRELWQGEGLNPLNDQIAALAKYGFSATWLLQYDTLFDPELIETVKKIPPTDERGLFLEVSNKLAQDSKVFFDSNEAWFSPKVVFLSSYERSERERLIDKYFAKFKEVYGYYPQSVGAWWLDSYSLEYIKAKYGLKSVMIVADQLSTDQYGVWGQWWGVPYYPQKQNVLLPATDLNNNLDVAVIQWAQRHPEKAYGDTPAYSNFSLQANDYIRLGQKHNHFIELINFYLDCSLPLGQITIGMETGQESVAFHQEYLHQLDSLVKIKNLQSVTMSEFSERFRTSYPGIVWRLSLTSDKSVWELSTKERKNSYLGDEITYSEVSFADYFKADKSGFLDRNLTRLPVTKKSSYYPLYIWIFLIFAGLFYNRKRVIHFMGLTILSFGFFGLLYKSYYQLGWGVYFGPVTAQLVFWQSFITIIFFGVFFLIGGRINGRIIASTILTLGIQSLLGLFRYTIFEGKKVIGISFDSFHLFGLSFDGGFLPNFFNFTFPATTAGALYKIPLEKLWSDPLIYFILLPIIHLLLGFSLWVLFQRIVYRGKWIIIGIVSLLTILYFYQIIHSDPLSVIALH